MKDIEIKSEDAPAYSIDRKSNTPTKDEINRVKKYLLSKMPDRKSILNCSDAQEDFKLQLSKLEHEEMHVMLLDNKHRVIKYECLFRGTIDSCSIHTRELIKFVLNNNASAIILGHNHPAGDCTQSNADIAITNKIVTACKTIDVKVLDHIIVGNDEVLSFAKNGLI